MIDLSGLSGGSGAFKPVFISGTKKHTLGVSNPLTLTAPSGQRVVLVGLIQTSSTPNGGPFTTIDVDGTTVVNNLPLDPDLKVDKSFRILNGSPTTTYGMAVSSFPPLISDVSGSITITTLSADTQIDYAYMYVQPI